ncbi:LmeA family phospholipid-binding protein [Nodosilinea sp. AN01ver1]|uniref:LmeA family phospholipid-binding protein n=1 Tax=Nodosilinea sp. AN01ver1 TaxID=3423362 RepID=UPI003D310309
MPSDPAATPDSDASTAKGSRIISRLLPPAIRLWLHSQLDHIEGLEFAIDGKDRQILAGYLPKVTVAAHQAVYQGLHVSQVTVSAADIRVNLPQVLRGKALRLLQPFPVDGQVSVLAADLRASLQSALLGQGLRDVLKQLLAGAMTQQGIPLDRWLGDGEASPAPDIALATDRLTLCWPPEPLSGDALELTMGLAMREGRWLCLHQPVATVLPAIGTPSSPVALDEIEFDLGPEVNIRQLDVTPTGIDLVGMVRVIPAD